MNETIHRLDDGGVRVPWVTVGVAAVCVGVAFFPAVAEGLTPRREGWLLPGLITGNLCHWSVSHLAWDLAVFVGCGWWLELRGRRAFGLLLVAAGLASTVAWWVAAPELGSYRGLSGVDTALVVAVVSRVLVSAVRRRVWGDTAMAVGAFLLVLAKTGWDLATRQALVADLGAGYVPVPAAHLAGLLVGVGFGAAMLIRYRPAIEPSGLTTSR